MPESRKAQDPGIRHDTYLGRQRICIMSGLSLLVPRSGGITARVDYGTPWVSHGLSALRPGRRPQPECRGGHQCAAVQVQQGRRVIYTPSKWMPASRPQPQCREAVTGRPQPKYIEAGRRAGKGLPTGRQIMAGHRVSTGKASDSFASKRFDPITWLSFPSLLAHWLSIPINES